MMTFQMPALCFFLIQHCWGLLPGLNHVNASLPKRSQQLMTWFTFHLENCSDWKALPGQESTIVPNIWARSWTLLFPYPACETGPSWPGCSWSAWSHQPGGEDQSVSWAGALVAPPGPAQSCWCSSRFLLLRSPCLLPLSCPGSAQQMWLCTAKTTLCCSTGNFYYPVYFRTYWFYDPVFFLRLNATFLCPFSSFVFSLMNFLYIRICMSWNKFNTKSQKKHWR